MRFFVFHSQGHLQVHASLTILVLRNKPHTFLQVPMCFKDLHETLKRRFAALYSNPLFNHSYK